MSGPIRLLRLTARFRHANRRPDRSGDVLDKFPWFYERLSNGYSYRNLVSGGLDAAPLPQV